MSKPSNQRSIVKNPNNPAFKAAIDNRSVQLNKQVTATTAIKIKTNEKK